MTTETEPGPRRFRALRRFQKRVRRHGLGIAGRYVLWLLSHLPRSWALAFGRTLGRVGYYLFWNERRRIHANLELAYGDELAPRERRQLARTVCRNLCENLMDCLVLHRWGPERIVTELPIVGWERARVKFEELFARGRGILAITGHLGNWDLLGTLACREYGDRALAIARRYESEGYGRIVDDIRRGLGINVIHTDEGMRRLVQLLSRKNGLLGVLADVDAKRISGVFVDWFGRPAHTAVTPAMLSLKLGTPLLPIVVLRQGPGYRVIVRDAIWPEDVAGAEDPVRALTELWSRAFEAEIRRHPEQWIWNHNRWRTTPEILEKRRIRDQRRAAGIH